MRVEIAVRRISRLQVMTKEPQDHSQVTAICAMMDVQQLYGNGHLRLDAHPYDRMFQSDLELFVGISGTRTLSRSGEKPGENCLMLETLWSSVWSNRVFSV